MRLHQDGGICQDPENCDGAYDPTQPNMAPPDNDHDRAREGSLPRTTVWANGYGIFHVRVPRHAAAPLIAARRLLRDALTERYGNELDPRCWREPVRVMNLDTEDSIVYQERFVDIEGTESLPWVRTSHGPCC